MTLEEMRDVDVRTVSRDDLVDIRDVVIDQDQPKEERIKSFIRQIRKIIVFRPASGSASNKDKKTGATLVQHFFGA